jgi:uncharacterized protein
VSVLPRFRVKEFKPISLENGYLIDGFPSAGFTSAIATESLIHTSQFDLAGIIDSDSFPAVSLVKDGKPNYPTRIFVNNSLNVAVFSSYLSLQENLHKPMARFMLSWARKHKVSHIISSVAVKSNQAEKIIASGSTEAARAKLKETGIEVLEHGTIPGIPGALLNQGMINDQNVIVVLYNSMQAGPDFKSSAQLCMAMSKLVPGAVCDITTLQNEAEKAELALKEATEQTQHMKEGMYG